MTQTYGHGGQHALFGVPQFEAPLAPQNVPAKQLASDAQPMLPHAMPAPFRQTRPPTPQWVTQVPNLPHVPQEDPSLGHGGSVVVVVLVVVVVVVGGATGAQSSFGALGVTTRLPNWSLRGSGGKVAFGHLTL